MTTGQMWPAPPDQGHVVELPIAAPPVLLDALDYRGDDQYVAIHRSARGAVRLDDGASRDHGELLAWHRFTAHRVTAPLANYDFGGDGRDATLWLLVDRHTNRLSVGHPTDVMKILVAQPHTRDRLMGNLAASRTQIGIVHPEIRAARVPTGPDWFQQASRAGYLLDAITHALDRAEASRLVEAIGALSVRVAGHPDTGRAQTAVAPGAHAVRPADPAGAGRKTARPDYPETGLVATGRQAPNLDLS